MFKSLNKAISTPIAIIVIVVLAGLVIGTVLAYQYWWAPEKQVETPTDETAGWKTYRNKEYGYEIKYHPDYSPYEDNDPPTPDFDSVIDFPKNNDETHWGITIKISTLKPDESCDSKKYADSRLLAGDTTSKQVFLNGISKEVTQVRSVYGSFTPSLLTFIPTQDCLTSRKMIWINGSEAYLTQYNQLLSTFRFIE